MKTYDDLMKELKEALESVDNQVDALLPDKVVDLNVWKELKSGGSNHYKTGDVEPIDLYKSGNMFHDYACSSIIKYAFRSRRDMVIERAKFQENMDKIIHIANLLKAMAEEK